MFKNLKIRMKLDIAFITILTCFFISSIVGLVGISNVAGSMNDFYDNPFTLTDVSREMREKIKEAQRDMLMAIILTESEAIENKLSGATACIDRLYVLYEQALAVFNHDKSVLEDFKNNLDQGKAFRLQIYDLIRASENDKATDMMENQYMKIMEKAEGDLDVFSTYVQQDAKDYRAQGQRVNTRSMILLIAFTAFGWIFGIIMSVRVASDITKPIKEIEKAAKELANGNLKADIQYKSNNELGNLAHSMRKTINVVDGYITDIGRGMQEVAEGNLAVQPDIDFQGDYCKLRDSLLMAIGAFASAIMQIDETSNIVANGSQQMSAGAQILSQGAAEQAASIQQLNASITLVTAQMQQSAQDASVARDKAGRAGDNIEESSRQMEVMISAMGKINQSSGEIGKIIKTIEDIAFQTNILALNAAVEAARAGSAGKGFAVVAEEVRSLASKSAEAAQNTASLIEESIRAVENGTKIADETAKSLFSIVDDAKDAAKIINNIAEASKQQAEFIKQISGGVDQISGIIQTNTATAEETAASSEELAVQAQILKDLTDRFQLPQR